jgi:hypothetical protein
LIIPMTDDNCELDTESGLVSKLVEEYVKAFKLSSTLQQVMANLNNVVAKNISNNVNAKLQSFFKPFNMTIQLNGTSPIVAALNLTLLNNIFVNQSDNIAAASFAIIPSISTINATIPANATIVAN